MAEIKMQEVFEHELRKRYKRIIFGGVTSPTNDKEFCIDNYYSEEMSYRTSLFAYKAYPALIIRYDNAGNKRYFEVFYG